MKIRVRLTPEDETEPKHYIEFEEFIGLMNVIAEARGNEEDTAEPTDEREAGAQ